MEVARALGLFGLAGLVEIGGGWLAWRWLRESAAWAVGLVGALVLVAYGVVPTLRHEEPFGRVYAAYGGVFLVLALLWGWWLNGDRPDRRDLAGALVVSIGVGILLLGPRPG
ncbi:MAG TPA: YnfA family protein [Acidimicrobiales bacterium]